MTLEEWTNFLSFLPFPWETRLWAQIAARKLQAVHAHAAVAVMFWLLTAVALLQYRRIRTAKLPHKAILASYIIVVGSIFFGPFKFMHSTLGASGSTFVPSMLKSWLLAALPLIWVCFMHRKSITRQQLLGIMLAFPLIHTLLTVVYLLYPIALVE